MISAWLILLGVVVLFAIYGVWTIRQMDRQMGHQEAEIQHATHKLKQELESRDDAIKIRDQIARRARRLSAGERLRQLSAWLRQYHAS